MIVKSESVQISVRRDTHAHYIRVTGEIDTLGAALLEAVLMAVATEHPHHVDVDLGGATFFGCAGVSALIAGRRALDGRIALVFASVPVRRVLNLVHLTSAFEAPAAA